ncbi:MAG: hypothetical protein ACYTFG_01585 [Planctomycetota bacterium]
MSFRKRGTGSGLILPLVTIGLLFVGLAAPVHAGDAQGLYDALEKKAGEGEDVPALAKGFVATVKGASKEAKENIKDLLQEKYNLAKMTLEDTEITRIAKMTSILVLAGKEAGETGVYGNARMVLWQELFDTAGSATMDTEEKIAEGAILAKNWQHIWEDLFLTVMREHGVMEAKGDEASMKQYMDQLEIMAKGWKSAHEKDDLLKKYEGFKEALEKWKKLSPEDRDVKKRAESGFKRAEERLKHNELQPAKSIIESVVIPNYEKIKDLRGLMKTYMLKAKVHKALKENWLIGECVEKAIEYADQVKDVGFKSEAQNFLDTLKKEGIDTTKNPFTQPGNLEKEVTIKLKPAYGQVRESRPLPQCFDNHYFWRAVDLETGNDDKGKPKSIKQLPFPGPMTFWLHWKGGSEIQIADDEAGKRARTFKVGKFSPVKETVNIAYWDGVKNKNVNRPYKLMVVEANAKVTIAGSTRELPPNPNYLGIRLHSDTYRQGKIDGQRLILCDDNTNAMFTDQGTVEAGNAYNDHKFFGCDTIVTGSGRGASTTLFGGLIPVKGNYWFVKAADKGGMTMVVRKYKGPTGKIQLKFNGAPRITPLHFIVGTATGADRLGFINIGGSKGPVSVPAGAYWFKWGLLCRGSDPNKGDRVEIWKGTYPKFKVEEGKTVTLEFGGPFDIQVPVHVTPDLAELQTYNLKIFGAKGEEYRRFWNKPFTADFKIKGAKGKTVKAGKLRAFTDQDELTPLGKGIGLLEFAKHVLFKGKAGVTLPLKAEFSVKHPLMGAFKTKGW